jgi:hypothetical protein
MFLYFLQITWGAYAALIPTEILVQTKAETHGIERNNFRQGIGAGDFAVRPA